MAAQPDIHIQYRPHPSPENEIVYLLHTPEILAIAVIQLLNQVQVEALKGSFIIAWGAKGTSLDKARQSRSTQHDVLLTAVPEIYVARFCAKIIGEHAQQHRLRLDGAPYIPNFLEAGAQEQDPRASEAFQKLSHLGVPLPVSSIVKMAIGTLSNSKYSL